MWNFISSTKGYWVECIYDQTSIALTKRLAKSVSHCRVTYERNVTTLVAYCGYEKLHASRKIMRLRTMKRAFILAVALVASGCTTTTPATYSMSSRNNTALKQFTGNKVRVTAVSVHKEFNPRCGLFSTIQTSNNITIPQFVQSAFNDELMFSGLHAYGGVTLTAELTKIDFSANGLLSSTGTWDLGMLLKSRNEKSISVESHYEFAIRGDALRVCNQTTQALVPAVQKLIYEAVTNPEFVSLIQE